MQLRIDDAFGWTYGGSFDRHTETHVRRQDCNCSNPAS